MSSIDKLAMHGIHSCAMDELKNLVLRHCFDDTQDYGYVILRSSVEQRNTKMTEFLLNKGAKTNSTNNQRILTSTPLHFAVKNGDFKIVQMLLSHGAAINAKDVNGSTPLLLAIRSQRDDIVECLLKRGALLLSDNEGRSPIHVAVEVGSYSLTEKLLKSGACVNSKTTSNGLTPLLSVICSYFIRKSILIIDLLLQNGARTDCVTNDGFTALHIVCKEGHLEIVDLLLKYNADINARTNESFTPLYLAIKNSKTNVANMLIEKGAKLDVEFTNGKTVLSIAIDKNLSTIVENILIRCPAVENKINRQSFKAAVKQTYYRDSETMRILLKYGFSIEPEDVNDFELLYNSIEYGFIQIIEQFLEHGLDLTSNNENVKKVLHIAQKGKQIKAAKLLLAHGADVNAKDMSGNTPLFYAVEDSDTDMTKCLIQHGADVQTYPKLILIAAKNLCKQIVEILIENKIDIKTTDCIGRTALHIVASKESYSKLYKHDRCNVAEVLLNAGADPNAKTIQGEQTPLHTATKNGFFKIVQLLLSNKANINSKNKIGETAVHIATRTNNIELLTLLLENGAEVNCKNDTNVKKLPTPLHIACQLADYTVDFVKILLKHKAEVNCFANDLTPLHVAVKNYYAPLEVIHLLLNNKADVNVKNNEGNTALNFAICPDFLSLLLEYGADINTKNNYGLTPLQMALNLNPDPYVKREDIHSHSDDDDDYEDDLMETDDHTSYDRYLDNCIMFERNKYDIIYVILQHAIALDAVNLYYNNDLNLTFSHLDFDCDKMMSSRRKCCEIEIEDLKSMTIAFCKKSPYNILTMNVQSLAKYAKNEDIIKLLGSDHFKEKFPIYSPIIQTNFRKAIARRQLIDEAHVFFKSCVFQLPCVCIDHVLSFLSCDDLKNVNDSLKTTTSN